MPSLYLLQSGSLCGITTSYILYIIVLYSHSTEAENLSLLAGGIYILLLRLMMTATELKLIDLRNFVLSKVKEE